MLLRWRVGDNEASGIVEEPIVSRWSVGGECVTGTCCGIRTTDSVLSSLTHPPLGPTTHGGPHTNLPWSHHSHLSFSFYDVIKGKIVPYLT